METIPYGERSEQVGDLWLPPPGGDGAARPVVVMWHGGGYAAEAGRSIMDSLARDLCDRGWATWNLEYRRLDTGGGWPATWDDVAAGLDHLATLGADGAPLDLTDVTALGFSAGGPLALWASARREGAVRPARVVNQAGLADLRAVAGDDDISGNVRRLLGRPEDQPAAYARADPAELLPIGVPQLHVHGDADENVPAELTRAFVERARAAGDDAELVIVPGATHFAHCDPASPAWAAVVRWLSSTAQVRAG